MPGEYFGCCGYPNNSSIDRIAESCADIANFILRGSSIAQEEVCASYSLLAKALDLMLIDPESKEYQSRDPHTKTFVDFCELVDYKSRISVEALRTARDYAQALIEGKKLDDTSLNFLANNCSKINRLSVDAIVNGIS